MRSVFFATLGSVALLFAASAYGQSRTTDIPFEFQVGEVVLPAGHYDVGRVFAHNPNLLSLRSKTDQVYFITNSIAFTQAQPEDKLAFNRYGNRYFLSKVISAGSGNELIKSKTECEIARNTPKSGPDQIVLLARR